MKQSLINITVERPVKHSQRVKTSNNIIWSRLLAPLKSELPHFCPAFFSLAWVHAAQCILVNNNIIISLEPGSPRVFRL